MSDDIVTSVSSRGRMIGKEPEEEEEDNDN